TRRGRFGRVGCVVAALAAGVLFAPAARAESEEAIAQKQARQKQVQADTDHVVRRIGTMLRVLEYYQLDRTAETKLLDEVAATLSGLSRRQMAEVVARLEAAARAPDEAGSDRELEQAYAPH